MGRTVADPWGQAAVEMDVGTVLGIHLSCRGSHAGPHDGGVHRQRQVARGAGAELVEKLEAHGPVALGDDQRPQIITGCIRAVLLVIAPEQGSRYGQVRVHLLLVLLQSDLIIVRSQKRCRIRNGKRDVLSEVVGVRGPKTGQLVNELPDVRALREVGQCVVDDRIKSDSGRIQRVSRNRGRRPRGHEQHGCGKNSNSRYQHSP